MREGHRHDPRAHRRAAGGKLILLPPLARRQFRHYQLLDEPVVDVGYMQFRRPRQQLPRPFIAPVLVEVRKPHGVLVERNSRIRHHFQGALE